MFGIKPAALSLSLLGIANPTDALGCYPLWVAGTNYAEGEFSSFNATNYQCKTGTVHLFCGMTGFNPGDVSGHWTVAWTSLGACTGSPGTLTNTLKPTSAPTNQPTYATWAGGGCPNPWTGGKSYAALEKAEHNGVAYECKSLYNPFCGQVLYEPGVGQYWSVAWTVLGSCSGVIAPTTSPTFSFGAWAGAGCPDPYVSSASYVAGDKVSLNGVAFQCKVAAWCSSATYVPFGQYSGEAWEILGTCSGTIAPTTSPTHTGTAVGCPATYAQGTYAKGDKVEFEGYAYECITDVGYCAQAGYAPGTIYESSAWSKIGWCSGTIAPTVSPTHSTTAVGCPDAYADGADYAIGDQISFEGYVYTCKSVDWCGSVGYGPGSQNEGTAWTKGNWCSGTIAPTVSPTHSTTAVGCPETYADNTKYSVGDQVEFEGYVYECKSVDWCGSPGYGPGSQNEGTAWTKGNWCSGTIAPTVSPTHSTTAVGCPDAYADGADYAIADQVSFEGYVYTCKSADWCGSLGYGPGSQNEGTAWTKGNWCSGTIAPTVSPTHSTTAVGCPETYADNTKYAVGDQVEFEGYVYECKSVDWCGSIGYGPGTALESSTWTKGNWCSGTIAPTVSPTHSTTAVGCPNAYANGNTYAKGDQAEFEGYVYECITDVGYCGQVGYSPGSLHESTAWTKGNWCSGTIAPTVSPTHSTTAVGCPETYANNVKYAVGDQVEFEGYVYECISTVGYCGHTGYAPGTSYESTAWTKGNWCTGTIAPTTSPTHSGVGVPCPATHTTGTKYKTGDQVEFEGYVYQCKTSVGYCGQAGYAPGTYYEATAWTKLGWCTGTFAPTTSPTAYNAPPTCPPVWSVSASCSYTAGTLVRKANKVYRCKNYPYYLWCCNSAYEPGGTGPWAEAWSAAGTC